MLLLIIFIRAFEFKLKIVNNHLKNDVSYNPVCAKSRLAFHTSNFGRIEVNHLIMFVSIAFDATKILNSFIG
jgi:hypothetical protein